MTLTQAQKAQHFRDLHQRPGLFLIPNPWDGGSARLLQHLGYEALATSSGAAAATYGRTDGRLTRDEALAHVRQIAEATELPVSADLENGFADTPEAAASVIPLAAEAGAVGCSIEDFTGQADRPIYDLNAAVDRVAAAVAAARALPFPFTLTARSENFLRGNPDLADTIRRLNAYAEAGAEVLFAPGLPNLEAVREICASVSRPVNFMVGIRGKSFSREELAQAGVKRVSFASSLYRAAMTGLLQAATGIRETGAWTYLDTAMTTPEMNQYLG